MRILHIANDFFPYYSGTPVRLYNMLSNLPAQIVLYIPARERKLDQHFSNIFVRRIVVKSGGLISRFPYLSYLISVNRWYESFFQAAQKEHFDIIHGHTPLRFGLIAQKVAKALNKPFIYEAHGLNIDFYRTMVSKVNPLYPSGYTYVKMKEKELMDSSVHIICLTNALKARIQTLYQIPGDKISVIPNGVDVDKFMPDPNYEDRKKQLGISGKIVMYAGYLDKVNGIKELGWLIPRILRHKHEICFIFVGRGPEEKKIQELSKKYPINVKYLGMEPHEEMPFYYQMSDVFIIPRPPTMSAEILTPLKLLEVMAMERCVLASDVGGMSGVITNGQNGYLFRKGNLLDMEKSLLRILDNDTTLIGCEARKNVIEHYSWEKSRQTLMRVYQNVKLNRV